MKFMIIRKADADTEAGVMPSDELLTAMGRYNEALIDAGVWVTGEGLQPSSKGFQIRFSQGQPQVIDGPFAETKELIAGYTMIEVASPQEAIDWALRWPREDAEGNARLELRQVFGLEDFAPSDGLALHTDLDQRIARQPNAVSVHLSFNGNCREALAFYADCLGGHLTAAMTYGETPAAADFPSDWQDKIIHAELKLPGVAIMGADVAQERYKKPAGVSITLEISDPQKAERVFEQLSAGGEIQMPFEETFWAHRFGVTTDRFGTSWMINCSRAGEPGCAL